ncbi:MAG: 7-cyano-7-deazaguanine synthase, partial [Dehalococcoidia bacterium]|nr:7-cyano-7-deazaguanine synthase [Dehalococcoidia bacterium]
MKRCTKCILPANFPGIAFGRDGVCSYCLHHKSIAVRGESELERILAPYRGKGRVADCIVTISGGRDSAYVLHQIVKKYQMNVLAVTFDNGLLTPEAHRNWRHFQDALGVRHHVIQAKKEAFRKDIAKNLHAWLKKPSLLMIPIFVSSDKIAEIYVNKFARQNDIPFIIRGGCEIEK